MIILVLDLLPNMCVLLKFVIMTFKIVSIECDLIEWKYNIRIELDALSDWFLISH